jgi:predicted DNA-binding protein (MmcQ/YjbR family)
LRPELREPELERRACGMAIRRGRRGREQRVARGGHRVVPRRRTGLRRSLLRAEGTLGLVMARRKLGSEELSAYCGSRPGALATRPFGPEPLVFKVAGRMFALLGDRDGQEAVSLKCAPERSALLRTSYPAITPGYHLNKEHWNTVVLDGTVPDDLVRELIDHSYELVSRAKLRAKKRRPPRRRPSK